MTIDKIFVVEGKLVFGCQEGGLAADAWELDDKDLDDLVAEHFGIEREQYTGNRPIGRVRITIEKLSDGKPSI